MRVEEKLLSAECSQEREATEPPHSVKSHLHRALTENNHHLSQIHGARMQEGLCSYKGANSIKL